MKFAMKDLLSRCTQIRGKLRMWSHLLKKSLMENFVETLIEMQCFSYNFLWIFSFYSLGGRWDSCPR